METDFSLDARIDIWIVLFLAAAAQGIFLSLMLFLRKATKKQSGQYLLATLVLTFTITIAYYTTYWMKVNPQLPTVLRIILYFTYLFGPLCWMYLHQTIYNRLPKRFWLHFMAFPVVILTIIFASPLFIANPLAFQVLQVAHLVLYAIVNLVLARKIAQNQWVRNVALSFAGYVFCFLLYYILTWTSVLLYQHDYMVSFGMAIFIYFIGYHGFKAPTFSNGNGIEQKYQKSSLTDKSIDYIAKKLDDAMERDKLYTKGDLKLQEVADALDIGVHALSQAINVAKDKKFTDYLNELRVEEAIRLMRQPDYKDDKLLAIAIDSGFNNKTSFLNAFRKQTGQAPSEYRKNLPG